MTENDTSQKVEIAPRDQEHGVAAVKIDGDTVTIICICGDETPGSSETEARKSYDKKKGHK